MSTLVCYFLINGEHHLDHIRHRNKYHFGSVNNHNNYYYLIRIRIRKLLYNYFISVLILTAKDDLDLGLGTWKPLLGIKSALSLSCGSESELSGSGWYLCLGLGGACNLGNGTGGSVPWQLRVG